MRFTAGLHGVPTSLPPLHPCTQLLGHSVFKTHGFRRRYVCWWRRVSSTHCIGIARRDNPGQAFRSIRFQTLTSGRRRPRCTTPSGCTGATQTRTTTTSTIAANDNEIFDGGGGGDCRGESSRAVNIFFAAGGGKGEWALWFAQRVCHNVVSINFFSLFFLSKYN
jgi:hypothetical protein